MSGHILLADTSMAGKHSCHFSASPTPHRDPDPCLSGSSSSTLDARDAARQDVFEYIEMFYNPTRKHTNKGLLSPVDFEARRQKLNEAGV